MKVLLRAPLLTNSGYGVHSRQVFEWLHKKEDVDLTVECLNWGMTSWIVDGEKEDGLIAKIMSCSRPVEKGSYDITYQVQLPDEWDISLGKINVGVTAAVETNICSPKWVEACNRMNKVIVPSTFTKEVIERSGVLTTPIEVVPEWFNNKIGVRSLIDKTLNDKRFNEIKTNFNALIVGQLTSLTPDLDRKNLTNTLKWCFDFFKDKEDTGIVIKTNFGKSSSGDKRLTRKFLEEKIKSFRKGDFPKVYLVHGAMEKNEIASIYKHKSIKFFAMATRGEGYGLPLIEAAASGLPIVTTNWSGHLEFLKEGLFYPVDYDLVNIPKSKVDNRIFFEKTKWADPKEESFLSQLNDLYENYNIAKDKSAKLKKIIEKEFNKESVCNLYEKIHKGLIK